MTKLIQDFKEFAVKGNMIDMAIGIILGTAFNKVVDVIVKDIFMPPLAMLTGGINWEDKKVVLREAVIENGETTSEAVAIAYGRLIEVMVDFLIIAITVFVIIRVINAMKKKAEDPKDKTVQTPKNIELLSKMTDLLEEQNTLLKKES